MKTRITGPAGSCYHVFSRIIEKRFYLGRVEKNAFCSLLRRVADFSGVNVLTYCVMDNHFHILIKVPEHIEISDDELLRRLKILYGSGPSLARYDPVGEFIRSKDNTLLRNRLRGKYLRRMYDLSEFMRTLKIRYSFWFNRNHDREGTLWDARFKSVLVQEPNYRNHQSSGNLALATMAAYIDLNAVRAGITDNPGDYIWCGYAQAMQGDFYMKQGLCMIYNRDPGDVIEWDNILQAYRGILCQHGMLKSTGEYINLRCCRIRYFTRGGVLGCQSFVEEAFKNHRWMFSQNRKTGARKLRGGIFGEALCVIRDVGV